LVEYAIPAASEAITQYSLTFRHRRAGATHRSHHTTNTGRALSSGAIAANRADNTSDCRPSGRARKYLATRLYLVRVSATFGEISLIVPRINARHVDDGILAEKTFGTGAPGESRRDEHHARSKWKRCFHKCPWGLRPIQA